MMLSTSVANNLNSTKRKLKLYDSETLELLQRARAKAESEIEKPIRSKYHFGYEPELNDSSDDDINNRKPTATAGEDSESSLSEGGGSLSEEEQGEDNESGKVNEPQGQTDAMPKKTKSKRHNKPPPSKKKLDQLIRQLGTPPLIDIGIDDKEKLRLPVALLKKEERQTLDPLSVVLSYMILAESTSQQRPVVVLALRSGRFAGAVFVGSKCVQHTTSTRYTIRKGQGKAQSAQDEKKRPKSVGSQLRRAGEQALREDVATALQRWSSYIHNASLVLLSCPKVMLKGLFDDTEVLSREDDRIRKVPLDIGRPSFEMVQASYEIMMTVFLEDRNNEIEVTEATGKIDEATKNEASLPTSSDKLADDEASKRKETIPLSDFHNFASEGNLADLVKLVDSTASTELEAAIHARAGPDFMTPLHFAAEASTRIDPVTAAACVTTLLVQGHANPTLFDSRHRVPYFLASHEKVREAFRMARATLGEDAWEWDEKAKVGPALTMDDVHRKKEKAAEKKRKQRARQKEKKAREKAESEAAERKRQEAEEEQKQLAEAKRIRDGLAAAKGPSNSCDFCQRVCRGKRRSQMFQRLDYAYCSTDCVNKHKRELMAKAAMARFASENVD